MSLMKRINRISPHKFVVGLVAIPFAFVLLISGVIASLMAVTGSEQSGTMASEPKSIVGSYSSVPTKKKANRAAYDSYMYGYDDPSKGEVMEALSANFEGEELKAAALTVLGARDRMEGKPPRYELMD